MTSSGDTKHQLQQINDRAHKFAEALEHLEGTRLRAFVVHAFIGQYFGQTLLQHPSFFCLLQLTTLLVKLLSTSATEACGKLTSKTQNLTILPASAAGGITPRADAIERRGAELYWLLCPMMDLLVLLPHPHSNLPELRARGDLYMAIKSTVASLRKIWLLVDHRRPRCPHRRSILSAVAKLVALQCIQDVFYAVLPTPNHPSRAASDSYLDLDHAPYVLYGVKYIDPVSLSLYAVLPV